MAAAPALSDKCHVLDAFFGSIRKFTSDDAYTSVQSLVSEIQDLQQRKRSSDDAFKRILEENAEVTAETRKLKAREQELIQLSEQLEEDKKKLESDLKKAEESLQGEKKRYDDTMSKAKEMASKFKELQSKMSKHKETISRGEESLRKEEKLRNDLTAQLATTEASLAEATQRANQLGRFSVQLGTLQENTVSAVWSNIWQSVYNLAESHFSGDLSDESLTDGEAISKIDRALANSIPLPPSNTPAAKQMRIAAVTALLARAMRNFLFLPPCLVCEKDTHYKTMLELAHSNSDAEAHYRSVVLGILQLLPRVQEANACSARNRVVGHMIDFVGPLLSQEAQAKFTAELGKVCGEVQDEWRRLQQAEGRYETHFELDDEDEWDPIPLGQAPGRADEKVQKMPSSTSLKANQRPPDTTNGAQLDPMLLVVWPGLEIIGPGVPELLHRGLVLYRSQTRDAESEKRARATRAGRPAAEARRKSRAMSIPVREGNGSFLGSVNGRGSNAG